MRETSNHDEPARDGVNWSAKGTDDDFEAYFGSIFARSVSGNARLSADRAGRGLRLYDDAGRHYWGGSGGSGAISLGHQHPRVVQAVQQQAAELLHVGWNVPTGVRHELVQRLGRFAPYCAVLLAVAGTEETEAGLKVARAATGRRGVLAFDRAFHGKSTGALGATWKPSFRAYSAFDRDSYRSVPYPMQGIGSKLAGVTVEQCLTELRSELEELGRCGELPAALIVEPIQAAEGVHAGGADFLREVVELARRYGIVSIFDEIYMGFGRTGAPFHCVKTGVLPDLLLFGKGLGNGVPSAGVMGPSRIKNALPAGNHSSTFAANPLSCAAGLAVLDVMEATEPWLAAERLGSELRLGIVPQTPVLFSGTIADNIRYGNPDATDEAIEKMAGRVGGWHWLKSLPNGLATKIGESGKGVSMGQRQLISLCRVMLRDPRILILDEPTASIDPFTESRIQASMNELFDGRTVLVIAHRLSTIKSADRIVVLERGKLVEQGNHEELLEKGGHYADLYNQYYRHQELAI
ncbi:aminotransferase class III-fold pyridoxal phosphate-dependent enzyme [Paenibacillus koleovorans]|uniref:aminotransferase class III-fold pyridoxal phosphate-dependent enzyme n=1 Tax=Paenibacillus koleovorans TaxID=121608 RepID=UPI001C3FF0B1|nr:aminotransferase class III-fold pyridoxal phosphate-dependent enzyme [Paenibacillus koleovorans]